MAEILVCDDDKDIVEAIEIYLTQEGHHILKAYDGEQAIRVLKNNPVDLLIIDELSYLTFNRYQSEMLFQIISERSERASVIISTNLEFSQWTQLFENEMLLAALIDSVTFRSFVLNMNCSSSYRIDSTLNHD